MQPTVDAVVEGAADAVEIAEERAAAGAEALDELFDRAAGGVEFEVKSGARNEFPIQVTK